MSGGTAARNASDRLLRRSALRVLAAVGRLVRPARGRRLPLVCCPPMPGRSSPSAAAHPCAHPDGLYQFDVSFLPAAWLQPALVRRNTRPRRVWVTATLRSFGIGAATAPVSRCSLAPSRHSAWRAARAACQRDLPAVHDADGDSSDRGRGGAVPAVCPDGPDRQDLGIVIGHMVHAMPLAFVIVLATLKAARLAA